MKKLQIFVSSTYTDLIEERQAAVKAILDAGHIPAGMELFKAGKSQMETIRKWIDESDVYMLILGGRYGSVEEESGLSYTELEYNYALSKNMPVFAIVLEDSFLFSNAISLGKNIVFENDNVNKYEVFKKNVKSNIVRFANNIDQIKTHIHSQINSIISDKNFSLVGWVKPNELIIDYSNTSDDMLCLNNQNIVSAILNRYHLPTEENITDNIFKNFSSSYTNGLMKILTKACGILDCSERQIRIDYSDVTKETIRVTITKIMKYAYIDYKEHPFYICFNSTKQQSETYKVHSLIIDNINYTSRLKLSTTKNGDRGQFIYNIQSNRIPLSSATSSIVCVSSYECPAIDFFQSHRLNCICRHFKTNIYLDQNVKNKYSLICSTFSPFSSHHYDDYKAEEVIFPFDEQISLPEWSLPGSGYVVTLKNKTEENHI